MPLSRYRVIDLTTVRSGPTCTKILADLGIRAALVERERPGQGQRVETSLLEALVGSLSFQAARYLNTAEVPPPVGNHHPLTAPMGVYRAKDGQIEVAALPGAGPAR